jgi:hypothetical protein
MHRTTRRKLGTSIITGALLVGLATGTARAQVLDDDATEVTVVVPAGGVTINAGADTSISDVTQSVGGTTVVSGLLSQVSVTDTRNLAIGWVTSVDVGDFTGPADATIAGASASVAVTSADTSQGLAVEKGFVGATAVGSGVVATAVALGNNSAAFTPSLSVVVPVGTAAGSYTGTVTFSVS